MNNKPNTIAPLEVGCVVTTNGGQRHTIAEIGFAGSEAIAENCYYHWYREWPYKIGHAAMDPDRDTVVSVSWPGIAKLSTPHDMFAVGDVVEITASCLTKGQLATVVENHIEKIEVSFSPQWCGFYAPEQLRKISPEPEWRHTEGETNL